MNWTNFHCVQIGGLRWSKVKINGKGVCVCLPMRVTPRLHIRPVFVKKNGSFQKMSLPIEKISMVCTIKPF